MLSRKTTSIELKIGKMKNYQDKCIRSIYNKKVIAIKDHNAI